MRPVTDVHDYNFKVKNAKKFLVIKIKLNLQSNLKEEKCSILI